MHNFTFKIDDDDNDGDILRLFTVNPLVLRVFECLSVNEEMCVARQPLDRNR